MIKHDKVGSYVWSRAMAGTGVGQFSLLYQYRNNLRFIISEALIIDYPT